MIFLAAQRAITLYCWYWAWVWHPWVGCVHPKPTFTVREHNVIQLSEWLARHPERAAR